MSSIIKGISHCWNNNLDYGRRLIADLSNEQMTLQPAGPGLAPANHAAWVFSHLNTYLPIIAALIEGAPLEDPKDAPFGMNSRPVNDPSVYESKEALLSAFVDGHQQVSDMLATAKNDIFERPIPLERWKSRMPTVGVALPYLMLNHENLHLGQLSCWRRVQGMPSV
jgi:hypothetical protein